MDERSYGADATCRLPEVRVFSGLTNPRRSSSPPTAASSSPRRAGSSRSSTASGLPAVGLRGPADEVHNFWDRGLLGLALHPNFPTDPRVYVLYAHDAIGGTAPRWGDGLSDLPDQARPVTDASSRDACRTGGRGERWSGWSRCSSRTGASSFPATRSATSRSARTEPSTCRAATARASTRRLRPGRQSPRNPCGDPPSGAGGTQTLPSAEGGALRSQDLRTAGDPVTLDGAILRLDPNTGRRCPEPHWQPGSECPEDRGERAPEPIPVHSPPREMGGLGRRRQLGARGRRSTASRTRPRARRTSGGRATREPRPTGYVPRHEDLHGLYAQATAPAPFSATPTAKVAHGTCSPGAAPRFRGWPSTGAAAIRGLRRGALLRRLLAALHLGDVQPGGRRFGSAVPGLVAAYGFNEGGGPPWLTPRGTGTSGPISGAAWTASGQVRRRAVL